MITDNELLKLKKQVEDASRAVSEKKGQKSLLYKQLKDEFQCSTIAQGDALLEDFDEQLSELNKNINTIKADLEELLNPSK